MLLSEVLSDELLERKHTVMFSHKPEDLPQQAIGPKKKGMEWFNRLLHDPDRDKPEHEMESRDAFAARVMRDLEKKGLQAAPLHKYIRHYLRKSNRKNIKRAYKDLMVDEDLTTRMSKKFGVEKRPEMILRYVNHDQNSDKFYAVRDIGNGHMEAIWGRTGRHPQGTMIYPVSNWDSLIGKKMKKGYKPLRATKFPVI